MRTTHDTPAAPAAHTVAAGGAATRVAALGGSLAVAPTQRQALLLKALTLPVEQAVEAWNRWAAEVVVDELEAESQWLLPMLFVRLRAAGVRAVVVERYANVFRHNWYKSHLRLRALRLVLDELQGFGHEPTLVGGASLAVACYPVIGARPFDAMTLAVPGDITIDEMRSAVRCVPAAVGTCLRWRTEGHPPATRQVSIPGLTLTVPDASDALVQLLADVANGSHRDDPSDLLWAVDAVMLSRSLDPNGWAEVWTIAADAHLTTVVETCLEWLSVIGLPIDRPVAR
jgi:hypothetical protein